MAINSKFTRSELRSLVRREIADAGTRWWTDAELNRYIEDWQNRVQDQHELVWGSATITATGSSTFTLTDIAADILRPDTVYYNNASLYPKSDIEMELISRNWRNVSTNTQPLIVVSEGYQAVSVWPPQAGTATGTIIAEYPKQLSFAADTSTHEIPAWTKYSARTYCAFRAYIRRGTTNNNDKARRYKAHFEIQLREFGKRFRNYFPKRDPRFRPVSPWELDSINPSIRLGGYTIAVSTITLYDFVDEVPTGVVDGTNTVFTLSTAPNPGSSLEFQVDGLTIGTNTAQSGYYTLSSNVVTLSGGPVSGSDIFARYRVAI